MVNAGRILIIGRGDWSNLENYEQLDLVLKGNFSYLARQASVGVDPETDTQMVYWQPFAKTVPIANTETPGIVMPDGRTITIDTQTGLIAANLGISDITDVVITSLTGNQILRYDATTQKWVNYSISDIQSPIEAMIAPIENGATTSKAYAAGEKFIRANVLYEAKVSIAQGASFASLALNTDYKVSADLGAEISALTNKTDVLMDNGAVNCCKNNATTTTTTDGTTTFTWTVNADKSITFSAPSYPVTVASNQMLIIWDLISADECKQLEGKTFRLTGCPSGGGSNNFKITAYRVETADGSSGTAEDFGNGKVFTWLNNASGTKASISISIRPGYTVTGPIIFKPMISLLELGLSYADYLPYAMSNREFTEWVKNYEEISSMIDKTQISVTDSTLLEITSVRIFKKGNMLNGFLFLHALADFPLYTDLLALPAGFRPTEFCNCIGMEISKASTQMFGLWANGFMQLQGGSVVATDNIRVQITGII